MSVAAKIAKAPPKPCPVMQIPEFLYILCRLQIWLRTELATVRYNSLKFLETSQLGHLSQVSFAILSQLMKVLMLSAPLKLTITLFSEEEYPVKPRTPLVRFKKTLGRATLYSWHSLQFHAWMETADSQAMADMKAISRAIAGEYAACVDRTRQRRVRREDMGFIFNKISRLSCVIRQIIKVPLM